MTIIVAIRNTPTEPNIKTVLSFRARITVGSAFPPTVSSAIEPVRESLTRVTAVYTAPMPTNVVASHSEEAWVITTRCRNPPKNTSNRLKMNKSMRVRVR